LSSSSSPHAHAGKRGRHRQLFECCPAAWAEASRRGPLRATLHGEIKRRTNAVGAFPDRASALRLVTAVALNVTAIWTDRRYLDMSLLEPKEIVVAKAA